MAYPVFVTLVRACERGSRRAEPSLGSCAPPHARPATPLPLQHARQQTGYRYSYLYSAWWETCDVSLSNLQVSRQCAPRRCVCVCHLRASAGLHCARPPPALASLQAYWGFLTVWVTGHLRVARTSPAKGEPYNIHPWNYTLAALMYVLGWAFSSAVLVLIVLAKLVPIILRAYVNHVLAAPAYGPFPWSKKWMWWFSPLWWLAFPLLPVGAALLVPGALVYASYYAAIAAADTVKERGAFAPGLTRLKEAILTGHRETTRYIMRQDVPFLDVPSSGPVSLPWLLIGIIPALLALVAIPVLTLLVVVESAIPVLVSGSGQ